MSSVFRKKKKEPLFDSGPEAFNLLMKEAVVREFLDERETEVLSVHYFSYIAESSSRNIAGTTPTRERGAIFGYGTTQDLGHGYQCASKIRGNIQLLLNPELHVSTDPLPSSLL